MKEIDRIIKEYGNDVNNIFVFPTGIAAREWLKKAIDLTDLDTIPADNFIAWDVFKKEFLQVQNDKLEPISKTVRKLFVEHILNQNIEKAKNGKPLFKNIIPIEFANNSLAFVSWLTNILPQLDNWHRKLLNTMSFSDSYTDDLIILKTKYSEFLEKYDLYEPSWFSYTFHPNGKKFILIFPKLLQDFDEYEYLLKNEDNIKIIHIPDSLKKDFNTVEFNTSIEEIDYCVSKIEVLLESGIEPDEIAVHVCDINEILPYLKREFEYRGIPTEYRYGDFLGNQSAGSMFRSFQDLIYNHWEFSTVKDLLLNPHLPWKHPEKIINLLNFGVNNHCLVSWQDGTMWKNIWKESFKKYKNSLKKEEFEIKSWFEQFLFQIENIVNAKSFFSMQTAYSIFRDTFLLPEEFSTSDNLVIARCIELLKELIQFEKKFANIMPDDKFEFFVSLLDDKKYVYQTKGFGINVFPFGVAAATPFKCQFVLNLQQKTANIIYNKLSFLRKDKKAKLNIVDNNVSTDFFATYYNTENPFFSYSKKTFSEYCICHNALLPIKLPDTEKQILLNNSFSIESLFFKNESQTQMPSLYEQQRNGAIKFFDQINYNKTNSFCFIHSPFYDKVNELNNVIDNFFVDGNLKLSSTSLSTYDGCRIHWLFSYVFNIEEIEFNPSIFNPMYLGSLYHRVAEQLYTFISETDKSFKKENISEYQEKANHIINSICSEDSDLQTTFAKPFLPLITRNITQAIYNLLEYDSNYSNNHLFPVLEKTMEHISNGIHFNGKLDRLSFNPKTDKYYLVDYKTNYISDWRDCRLVLEDDVLYNFQMAMYTLLSENHFLKGEHLINKAYFWSFKKACPSVIIDDEDESNTISRTLFDKTIDYLTNYTKEVKSSLEQRNFSKQDNITWQECNNCSFKSICRTTFSVESN